MSSDFESDEDIEVCLTFIHEFISDKILQVKFCIYSTRKYTKMYIISTVVLKGICIGVASYKLMLKY